MRDAGRWRFTVYICTRNRPEELRTALRSVVASTLPAWQVIVSDDSTDARTAAMVAAEFPDAIYLAGPRIGLGANRNNGLARVEGTHVLFIDDDVILAPDFLAHADTCLDALGDAAPTAILSGTELNRGERVFPHRPSFLGYQAIAYRDGMSHETVVINATVFPTALFRRTRFDPNLVYGCDEMDVAVRAVRLHGFVIAFRPALANTHCPSPVNRDYYAPYIEASRIYVQFKRYAWVERRPGKATVFLVLAYLHIFGHFLKTRRLAAFAAFARTLVTSMDYIRACRADPLHYT